MANKNLTQARPGSDHAPLYALADADLASRNPLAAKARATPPVVFADAWSQADVPAMSEAVVAALDADVAYRTRLIELYVQARGDWSTELHLLAEAARYDRAHPGGLSLHDELCGISSTLAEVA